MALQAFDDKSLSYIVHQLKVLISIVLKIRLLFLLFCRVCSSSRPRRASSMRSWLRVSDPNNFWL